MYIVEMNKEEQGAKDRSLWDTIKNSGWIS